MKESSFQFQDPILSSLIYNENSEFDIDEFKGMKIDFDVSAGNPENNSAFVSLTLKVGDRESDPFYISVTMGALFFWADCMDNDAIDDLLKINAPVLLTGYIRPIISSITSSSKFPTFNLPFVDFTK